MSKIESAAASKQRKRDIMTDTTTPTTAAKTTNQNTENNPIIVDDRVNIEGRCENPECSAPTLISLVPVQPTPQFVQNPHVVPSPILVNGYTSVFQVDGTIAKMTMSQDADGKAKYTTDGPLYRIVPDTHAHIVNYVIVDPNGAAMRKIRDRDPLAIKKLLESEVNSANQLLKKLLGRKQVEGKVLSSSVVTENMNPLVSQPSNVTNNFEIRPVQTVSSPSLVGTINRTVPPTNTGIASKTPIIGSPISVVEVPVQNLISAQQPIIQQTPILVQNNMSAAFAGQNLMPTVVSTPQIGCSVLSPVAVKNTPPVLGSAGVSINAFERMQAELKELRETVKNLTQLKATPKSQSSSDKTKKRKIS